MPRPARVFVAGGVNHVCDQIGRGEVLGVESYGLKVPEPPATLKKNPDVMSHALARGVRHRAEDERFRRDLRKPERAMAAAGTKA
jgi:hypothetical protein